MSRESVKVASCRLYFRSPIEIFRGLIVSQRSIADNGGVTPPRFSKSGAENKRVPRPYRQRSKAGEPTNHN